MPDVSSGASTSSGSASHEQSGSLGEEYWTTFLAIPIAHIPFLAASAIMWCTAPDPVLTDYLWAAIDPATGCPARVIAHGFASTDDCIAVLLRHRFTVL